MHKSHRYNQAGKTAVVSRIRAGFFGLPMLLLASCVSLPPDSPDLYEKTVYVIPRQANMVMRLKVTGNHELTSMLAGSFGVSEKTITPLLKRTASVVAGFEITPENKEFNQIPIHLAAIGSWPRGIMGSLLGKDWNREAGPFQWSGPNRLELAAPSRGELLISRGRLTQMLESRAMENPPAARQELPINADFAVLITNPELIGQLIPTVSGRVHAMSLSLAADQQETPAYQLKLVFDASQDIYVKPLLLALRLALSARFGPSQYPEERALLKRLKTSTEGRQIILNIPQVELPLMQLLLQQIQLFNPEPHSQEKT